MQKAFIFDMDGVIIDTERAWIPYGDAFLKDIFGPDIAEKIGDTIGLSLNSIYAKAEVHGFSMDKETLFSRWDKQAKVIYSEAKLTPGVDELANILIKHGFKLGLVSSSRQNWIDQVLPRLAFRRQLEYIVSINDQDVLRPKPHPDAYLEAIKKLGATYKSTMILEDSNSGIQAAKASGAFTIALTENLVPEYIQKGADMYADSIKDVINFIESRYFTK